MFESLERFHLTRSRHLPTLYGMSNYIANDGVPEVTLGWRLRMSMEHASIKADEMSAELGVHRGTITRWTHDVGSAPRPIYLQRWAELCHVPYGWLAGENLHRRRTDHLRAV